MIKIIIQRISLTLSLSSLAITAVVASPESDSLMKAMGQQVFKVPATFAHPSYDVGSVKALFYQGVPLNGKEKRVFAYVGIPEGASNDKPVPAMVLVHGGGGTAFHKWVKMWNDRGYAAIAMDLEGHIPETVETGGGRLSHPHSGLVRIGRFGDADKPLPEQWMYHAVSDIFTAHTLLASMPEVDADRIGVTGISWGGILSSLVSGIDPRYKCAIPVYGAGFLYESHGHFKSVKGDAQKFWDPARHFKDGKVPTLWVNGDTDGHFSVNITSRSYELTSDHAILSIHPGLAHGHRAGWDVKRVPEIYAFADLILKKEGQALTKITKQPTSRAVEISYESAIPIKEAKVYYLNEPLTYRKPEGGGKHDRPGDWIQMDAEVNADKKNATAQLPETAQTYYVNLIDKRGLISSSVLVELAKK